jgi:hypothetical protein
MSKNKFGNGSTVRTLNNIISDIQSVLYDIDCVKRFYRKYRINPKQLGNKSKNQLVEELNKCLINLISGISRLPPGYVGTTEYLQKIKDKIRKECKRNYSDGRGSYVKPIEYPDTYTPHEKTIGFSVTRFGKRKVI